MTFSYRYTKPFWEVEVRGLCTNLNINSLSTALVFLFLVNNYAFKMPLLASWVMGTGI